MNILKELDGIFINFGGKLLTSKKQLYDYSLKNLAEFWKNTDEIADTLAPFLQMEGKSQGLEIETIEPLKKLIANTNVFCDQIIKILSELE